MFFSVGHGHKRKATGASLEEQFTIQRIYIDISEEENRKEPDHCKDTTHRISVSRHLDLGDRSMRRKSIHDITLAGILGFSKRTSNNIK
jgi:hypothetical protein